MIWEELISYNKRVLRLLWKLITGLHLISHLIYECLCYFTFHTQALNNAGFVCFVQLFRNAFFYSYWGFCLSQIRPNTWILWKLITRGWLWYASYDFLQNQLAKCALNEYLTVGNLYVWQLFIVPFSRSFVYAPIFLGSCYVFSDI